MKRLATLLLLAVLAACSKSDGGSAAKKPKNPDRYADGRAIAEEREGWKKAWKKVQSLPSCADLEITDRDKALCEKAAKSRDALRELELRGAPTSEILTASAKLATDATHAWNTLREYGLKWLVDDLEKRQADAGATKGHDHDHGHEAHKPAQKPPRGSAKPPQAKPPPSGRPSAKGPFAAMHAGHGEEAEDPNPWSKPVKAYLGAAMMGMRRLSGHLRLGPLETRRAALVKIKAFVKDFPKSRIAQSALSDAWFSETNREMKAEIGKLRDQISAASRPKKK